MIADLLLRLAEKTGKIAATQVQAHSEVAAIHLACNAVSPLAVPICATCDSGMRAPEGNVTVRLLIWSGLPRTDSAKRTAMSYLRSPRNSVETAFPPIPDSMIAATSATLMPEAGRGLAIDLYLDLRQRRFLVDGYVGGSAHLLQRGDETACDSPHLAEVLSEHLDHEIAVRAGNLVVYAINHRLRKPNRDSRNLRVADARVF